MNYLIIIHIAENIRAVSKDGIDGYITFEQAKQEILKCVDEIKKELKQ